METTKRYYINSKLYVSSVKLANTEEGKALAEEFDIICALADKALVSIRDRSWLLEKKIVEDQKAFIASLEWQYEAKALGDNWFVILKHPYLNGNLYNDGEVKTKQFIPFTIINDVLIFDSGKVKGLSYYYWDLKQGLVNNGGAMLLQLKDGIIPSIFKVK